MEIANFTNDLVLKDGIYFAKNEVAISYPEKGNQDCFQIEDNSFWFKHRNKCIVEAVKKYSNQDLFFDIGGGNGFVSRELQNQGIESVLIEPGVQGCLNGKTRGLKNIICSTLEQANFKTNAIPNIGAFDVIEHIENDNEFVKMLHNYLAPNGNIFITVPAFNTLWSKEDEESGHYRRYTTKTINKLLTNNGFEIVYSSYIFSILPIPIFLSRSLKSVLKINKNASELKKLQSEHSNKKGVLDSVMNFFLTREINKIKKGKKIITGSSCFVMAKKK